MKRSDLSPFALVLALGLYAACGADPDATDGGTTSGQGAGTDDTDTSPTSDPTTPNPTADSEGEATDAGITAGGSTDAGSTDAGTTDAGTTDDGDPQTGSGSGDSGSSDGTTDGPMDPFGTCAHDTFVCDGVCFTMAGDSFCTDECADPTTCGETKTGDAPVSCGDPNDLVGFDYCYLDCSGGETCPDGMACIADQGHCAWPFIIKGGGECPDADNGSQTPQAIMGDNTGLLDDHVPSCSPVGGGEDALHQFTAPNTGTYTFTISETDSDTALFILDGCGGEEIACNQDIDKIGGNWLSEVEIELAADQTVIVGVDSWDGEVGPYTLTIAEN